MANLHLPPNWQIRLLVVVGGNEGYNDGVELLSAWQQAEGGTAQWNPLNTELRVEGSWNYNKQGVQNYARPIIGICATALTLANGYYNGTLGALQTGTLTAEQIVTEHAHEFDTWGTGAENVMAQLQATPG